MAASPKLGIRAGGDRHAPGESWLSSAPLAHSQGGGSSKNLQLFSVPRTERAQEGIYRGRRAGEAGDHPNFTSGGYDLLGAKGAANRAIAVHDRPTIKRSGPTAPVRACERGMVGST